MYKFTFLRHKSLSIGDTVKLDNHLVTIESYNKSLMQDISGILRRRPKLELAWNCEHNAEEQRQLPIQRFERHDELPANPLSLSLSPGILHMLRRKSNRQSFAHSATKSVRPLKLGDAPADDESVDSFCTKNEEISADSVEIMSLNKRKDHSTFVLASNEPYMGITSKTLVINKQPSAKTELPTDSTEESLRRGRGTRRILCISHSRSLPNT
ncbi:uncharacterized protein V1516DRAFT_98045 [Lipomyces oligophaga]|uniref:uncharacterized protein n=1 Tax=Lipomyces oligophaga TaxID=45792 RepID=UPI0034D01A90